MQNYYSVGAISTEIGVSDKKIYKVAKELGIDTQKITEARKLKLIKGCQETIQRKKDANAFTEAIKNAKVEETGVIANKSGSTLEHRLSKAKIDYDNVNKSLAECQIAINLHGTLMQNGKNGIISSNPAVKTMCELLKQKNALDKTINELEEKLKLSKSTSEEKRSVIGDE